MTIETFFADDKKRLCDACGNKDYLICITYPLGHLFQNMPTKKHAAVWLCKKCAREFADEIELELDVKA